jgi:hypothetical protein
MAIDDCCNKSWKNPVEPNNMLRLLVGLLLSLNPIKIRIGNFEEPLNTLCELYTDYR